MHWTSESSVTEIPGQTSWNSSSFETVPSRVPGQVAQDLHRLRPQRQGPAVALKRTAVRIEREIPKLEGARE